METEVLEIVEFARTSALNLAACILVAQKKNKHTNYTASTCATLEKKLQNLTDILRSVSYEGANLQRELGMLLNAMDRVCSVCFLATA